MIGLEVSPMDSTDLLSWISNQLQRIQFLAKVLSDGIYVAQGIVHSVFICLLLTPKVLLQDFRANM